MANVASFRSLELVQNWLLLHPSHDLLLYTCISSITSAFQGISTSTESSIQEWSRQVETRLKDSLSSLTHDVLDKVTTICTNTSLECQSVLANKQDHLRDLMTNAVLPSLGNVSTSLKKVEKFQDDQAVLMANSSNKGRMSEMELGAMLSDMLPSAEIIHASQTIGGHTGDLHIQRMGKPTILVENKDYTRNVPDKEVTKFLNDVRNTKCHGLFLAQSSGIVNKSEWEIMLIDSKYMCVFLTHVKAMPQKIMSAIAFIDYFDVMLAKTTPQEEEQEQKEKEKEESQTIVRLSLQDVAMIEKSFNQWYSLRNKLLKDLSTFAKSQRDTLSTFTFGAFEDIIREKIRLSGGGAAASLSLSSPEDDDDHHTHTYSPTRLAATANGDVTMMAGLKRRRKQPTIMTHYDDGLFKN
jgi:hypothetical protein